MSATTASLSRALLAMAASVISTDVTVWAVWDAAHAVSASVAAVEVVSTQSIACWARSAASSLLAGLDGRLVGDPVLFGLCERPPARDGLVLKERDDQRSVLLPAVGYEVLIPLGAAGCLADAIPQPLRRTSRGLRGLPELPGWGLRICPLEH